MLRSACSGSCPCISFIRRVSCLCYGSLHALVLCPNLRCWRMFFLCSWSSTTISANGAKKCFHVSSASSSDSQMSICLDCQRYFPTVGVLRVPQRIGSSCCFYHRRNRLPWVMRLTLREIVQVSVQFVTSMYISPRCTIFTEVALSRHHPPIGS